MPTRTEAGCNEILPTRPLFGAERGPLGPPPGPGHRRSWQLRGEPWPGTHDP